MPVWRRRVSEPFSSSGYRPPPPPPTNLRISSRYRFANEPESAEEDDDAGKKRPERRTYGGKVRIRFRRDGYSDILTPVVVVDDDVIIDHRVATFEKVWGWDLEAASSSSSGGSSVESKGGENDPSSPESSDFLLFSADVRLPPPISAVEKFYFQASVVSPADKRGGGDGGGLSLNDGTVTVKRDVGAPGGWWGAFRGGGGILARFRLVGEFRCMPVEAIPEP